MPLPPKNIVIIAAISMALAIIFGAFGAHKVKELISAQDMAVYKTASDYHIGQTLGLFAMLFAGAWLNISRIRQICYLLISGIVLFSGSLYLLALRSILGYSGNILGPLTPIGGALMITAWVWLAWSLIKQKS